jgi:hypothetical protein
MIERAGERALVGIAEHGEFFGQIESLVPPGFDQCARAARRGQAVDLAQDASNSTDFALLHRLPALEAKAE